MEDLEGVDDDHASGIDPLTWVVLGIAFPFTVVGDLEGLACSVGVGEGERIMRLPPTVGLTGIGVEIRTDDGMVDCNKRLPCTPTDDVALLIRAPGTSTYAMQLEQSSLYQETLEEQ